MISDREQLIFYLKSLSIKRGEEFTLASGQKSNIYIDVKKTMLTSYSMHLLSRMLYSFANAFGHYDMVAGAPLGGSHLATMTAMVASSVSVILVRKEVKDHGTQQMVELPGEFRGKKVILFEDVVSTGKSVLSAARSLEDVGCVVRGIVAVVDRRNDKTPTLGDYGFRALVDFEELIEDNAKEAK